MNNDVEQNTTKRKAIGKRNRFAYCDERRCLNLLKQAHALGLEIDELVDIAKTAKHWTGWRDEMVYRIEEMGG